MRRLILIALCAVPLAACATSQGPTKASVDAVVLDEGQRAKAADTANATASSTAAMATVSGGPKDQKPTPP